MENKEAIEYFVEQIEIEIRGIMTKMPTKIEMRSYCDHWLNTLATIKSLTKEN
jgi:hypothetical protein